LDRLHTVDPRLEVIWSGPLTSLFEFQIVQPRFYAFLLTSFALAAFILAGAGVYGAASYAVARRRRELGIRIALGAARSDLVKAAIGSLTTAALAGIVAGVVAGFFASKLLAAMLFEIQIHDVPTFIGAPVAICLGIAAATIPAARRALQLNPSDLLREE
jgi:ABC-type antimicrobial peptide transport system permease subunit